MNQCGEVTNTYFNWRCLRPRNHPGDHLDHTPVCPSCDNLVDPRSPFGPMQPARFDGRSAVLHWWCAERLASERVGGIRVVA